MIPKEAYDKIFNCKKLQSMKSSAVHKERDREQCSLTYAHSARPKNLNLLQYFIYLMVESQKLTYRVRNVKIVLSNISVMISIDKLLHSTLSKHVTNNRGIMLKNNMLVVCLENDKKIDVNRQKRKRADSRDDTVKESKLTIIQNENLSSLPSKKVRNKRQVSSTDENTAKRIKLQSTTEPENKFDEKDICEVEDEMDTEWERFWTSDLSEVLAVLKAEWNVKHLSNLHANLTSHFYNRQLYRPQYGGQKRTVPCTSIFDSTTTDLQWKILNAKTRITKLKQRLKRCPPASRLYYRLNKDIEDNERSKQDIKDRLARVHDANAEIGDLNKIYIGQCSGYKDEVLITDRYNLDMYKQFYNNNN